ncbi:MAG: alginate lyase family protein [Burkholderiales bacterium]|nr:alginate lyase family protein [Burkholderiales bacterium]
MHSLAVQARWLRARLEWHLLGNHLWANAKALVFAGSFFAGPEADAWRARGLEMLRHELREQVLPDGGHFELSPMYHAIVLEDLLDLIQLSRRFRGLVPAADIAAWSECVPRMMRWLQVMSHPDGEIAFFNDAAIGIAPNFDTLAEYAEQLGLGGCPPLADALVVLPDSGYVRAQAGPAVLIADVARIGPDHLPGHAHADTLSFELSLHGARVFVNGGTSTYERNRERLRQRGTAAHNTVEVNGSDSSEVWASFRVARRARPRNFLVDSHAGVLRIECAHDGYLRLPGRVLHRRIWRLAANRLEVEDYLTGSYSTAIARYHCHPSVRVTDDSRLQGPAPVRLRWRCEGASAHVREDSWHPEFGKALPAQCIELEFKRSQAVMRIEWD